MAVIALALICLLLLPFVVYKEGQWLLAVGFGTIYGIVLAVFYSISFAALSNMVPKSHESQYVGIEAFFTYCARPVTPLLYALIVQQTGSHRFAAYPMNLWAFIALIILASTNFEKGAKEAGRSI